MGENFMRRKQIEILGNIFFGFKTNLKAFYSFLRQNVALITQNDLKICQSNGSYTLWALNTQLLTLDNLNELLLSTNFAIFLKILLAIFNLLDDNFNQSKFKAVNLVFFNFYGHKAGKNLLITRHIKVLKVIHGNISSQSQPTCGLIIIPRIRALFRKIFVDRKVPKLLKVACKTPLKAVFAACLTFITISPILTLQSAKPTTQNLSLPGKFASNFKSV